MSWSNRHWYEAETLTAMLLRIRDTTDACHGGPTASLDQAREERPDDFQPARVEPLLRGPMQPAAPSATGLPPGTPARDPATGTRGTRDHRDAA